MPPSTLATRTATSSTVLPPPAHHHLVEELAGAHYSKQIKFTAGVNELVRLTLRHGAQTTTFELSRFAHSWKLKSGAEQLKIDRCYVRRKKVPTGFEYQIAFLHPQSAAAERVSLRIGARRYDIDTRGNEHRVREGRPAGFDARARYSRVVTFSITPPSVPFQPVLHFADGHPSLHVPRIPCGHRPDHPVYKDRRLAIWIKRNPLTGAHEYTVAFHHRSRKIERTGVVHLEIGRRRYELHPFADSPPREHHPDLRKHDAPAEPGRTPSAVRPLGPERSLPATGHARLSAILRSLATIKTPHGLTAKGSVIVERSTHPEWSHVLTSAGAKHRFAVYLRTNRSGTVEAQLWTPSTNGIQAADLGAANGCRIVSGVMSLTDMLRLGGGTVRFIPSARQSTGAVGRLFGERNKLDPGVKRRADGSFDMPLEYFLSRWGDDVEAVPHTAIGKVADQTLRPLMRTLFEVEKRLLSDSRD